MSQTQTVTSWPPAVELRELFAEQARRVAEQRQQDAGWSDAETAQRVRAAAADAAQRVARALVEAAEMGLDLWEASR